MTEKISTTEIRRRVGAFLGTGTRPLDANWTDDLIAVVEKAEADRADAEAYRALLDDTRHQIRFDERGWTIKHPMAERIKTGDRLFDCAATLVAQHLPPPEEHGTYYFSLTTEGDETTMEIEERVADE